MAKRFYESVSIGSASKEDAFTVFLDKRELKTPGRVSFALPKALAQLLADEWAAQGENIIPASMPITRLLNVAFERTPKNRDEVVAEICKYAGTDLICYRAAEPVHLRARQDAAWTPWQDWAKIQGVELHMTESLIAIEQPPQSLEAVADYAHGHDDISLSLLAHFTAVFGSAVLAMAVILGELDVAEAFDLSRVDADYQIELWGEDEAQAEITKSLREETLCLGKILDVYVKD